MLSEAVDRRRDIDTSRLGDLYLRHADEAVRLAYLLTRDRALAEDLVQDAFVRLAGRLVHLRDPGAFDTYLRKTVVNLANSYFRRRRIERRYELATRGAAPIGVPAHSVEDRQALAAALRKLPQRPRAALACGFYEDQPE